MSSNGARSGGGGSGVPDMIRPAKIRRKEIIKEKISKLPSVSIIRGAGKEVIMAHKLLRSYVELIVN